MNKQNKVAMITGAASGIGREVAIRLAQKGCRLCLVDLNVVQLETLEKELSMLTSVLIYTGDVADHLFYSACITRDRA